MAFVLDTSVALAWLLPDEGDAAIDALCDRLLDERALVPAIWPCEVGNVLLTAQRRGRITPQERNELLGLLAALPVELEPFTALQEIVGLNDLAVAHGLTTYDAAYLELAIRRELPLATLDRGLRQACLEAGVEVLPHG